MLNGDSVKYKKEETKIQDFDALDNQRPYSGHGGGAVVTAVTSPDSNTVTDSK